MSKSQTSKFNKDSVTNFMMKVGAYLGKNKRLGAMRDAFGIMIPLLILGSLVLVLNAVFLSKTGLIASKIANINPDAPHAFYDAMQA